MYILCLSFLFHESFHWCSLCNNVHVLLDNLFKMSKSLYMVNSYIQAMATEACMNFLSIKGPELLRMVGTETFLIIYLRVFCKF